MSFHKRSLKLKMMNLIYNDIPLMDIIKQYGTPLKITYLPRITQNIQRARRWFNVAIAKLIIKEITIIVIVLRVLISNLYLLKCLKMECILRPHPRLI
jgi:uncharacterized membrane protein YhdT